MQPGSVIYDLAADQGGNTAVTKADEIVDLDGVTYAFVATASEGAVQIINLTNPANPTSAGTIENLGSIPYKVEVQTINNSNYVFIASSNKVEIVN